MTKPIELKGGIDFRARYYQTRSKLEHLEIRCAELEKTVRKREETIRELEDRLAELRAEMDSRIHR